MHLQFDTIEQFEEMEKHFFFNGIKWLASNRYGADGTLLNINTGYKIPVSELDYNTFSSLDYPLFGRKNGVLNKLGGYTTKWHDPIVGADSKIYCKKKSDVTVPAKLGDDGEVLEHELIVPFTRFYPSVLKEIELEPEWSIE